MRRPLSGISTLGGAGGGSAILGASSGTREEEVNPTLYVEEYGHILKQSFGPNKFEHPVDSNIKRFRIEVGNIYYVFEDKKFKAENFYNDEVSEEREELYIDLSTSYKYYGIEHDTITATDIAGTNRESLFESLDPIRWIHSSDEDYFEASNRILLFEIKKLNAGGDDELTIIKNHKPGDIYIDLKGLMFPVGWSLAYDHDTGRFNIIQGKVFIKDWSGELHDVTISGVPDSLDINSSETYGITYDVLDYTAAWSSSGGSNFIRIYKGLGNRCFLLCQLGDIIIDACAIEPSSLNNLDQKYLQPYYEGGRLKVKAEYLRAT